MTHKGRERGNGIQSRLGGRLESAQSRPTMTPPSFSVASAAAEVRRRVDARPRIGIVLGSGFGAVAATIPDPVRIPYGLLPGCPVGTVPGHAGELLLGNLHGTSVAVLAGRAHYYEGFDWPEVTFGVRLLAELGVEELLLTNAAGGIADGLRPGDFLSISDHINFMGANPLRGPVAPGRARFVDLSAVYDPELRRRMQAAAGGAGVVLREGVYLAVSGPSYETPAEIRAFRTLGADAVGMSTVPEAIVARQCGMRVAGLSCITNVAAGLSGPGGSVSHAEVLDVAREVAPRATRLVSEWVRMRGGG